MKDIGNKQKKEFLKAYEELHDALFRYIVLKISPRDKAVDLVQESFARAWEYVVRGEEIRSIKSLLYRIAHNLVVDEYRKKKESSLDKLIEEGFDYGNDPQESFEAVIDGGKIIELAHSLDVKYRDAVIMRYVNDLSVKEIAEALGETENNISVRIHRGLEKLRGLLKDTPYEV